MFKGLYISILFSLTITHSYSDNNSVKIAGYTSSKVCGKCHTTIYNYWKNSLHALSIQDPIFDVSYMQLLKKNPKMAKEVCLPCHAPVVIFNKDYELKEEITREGVSCDFCHTIKDVNLENKGSPFILEVSNVKRGTLKGVSSPAHRIEYSEIHKRAEICGACHEHRGVNNVPLMSTYSEWKESTYREQGKHCQHCHMPLVEGNVVNPQIKESSKNINLHDIQGGHSLGQLKKSIMVEIIKINRTNDTINVDVKIKNTGSGHKIPTGIPSRLLILEVTLLSDNKIVDTQTREYRKLIVDSQGRLLKEDWEILMRGAKVLSDNRIAPLEERIESFAFKVYGAGEYKVRTKVFYLYRPIVLERQEMRVEINSSEKSEGLTSD